MVPFSILETKDWGRQELRANEPNGWASVTLFLPHPEVLDWHCSLLSKQIRKIPSCYF